jgi:hypothetical protein
MKNTLKQIAHWLGKVVLRVAKETLRRILEEEVRPKAIESTKLWLATNPKQAELIGEATGVIVGAVIAEIEKRI